MKERIKKLLGLIILPDILVFIISISIVILTARIYNIDHMRGTTILFFLIAYILILYDPIISEIGILRFKIRENNFLNRKRSLRYFLNIFKIILPIHYFLRFYTTYWKLIFLVSIIWISYYGFNAVKNTICVYCCFRTFKEKKLKEDFGNRTKYTILKPIRRFIIENNQIIEILN